MSERELREALAAARAQVAELLPYAYAGAEALDMCEPYGLDDADSWGTHQELCDTADVMLERIRSGEFRCRCGEPDLEPVSHGPVKCWPEPGRRVEGELYRRD